MPRIRSVSDVKAKLLRPALTSHYEVEIFPPSEGDFLTSYLKQNNINWNTSQDKIQLACSEALLPGSSFATHELNGDHTGVTERHVYRRVYDDRIDLTFYVDVDPIDPYVAIRFFEVWMKYVTNESIAGTPNITGRDFYYRVKYPKEYYGNLSIVKFERTGKNSQYQGPTLKYNFVGVFPLSVSSMPVSYDSSQLLKVTTSLSYLRYYIDNMPGSSEQPPADRSTPVQALSAQEQAALNGIRLNNNPYFTSSVDPTFNNPAFGRDTLTGGIPQWALSGKAFLATGNLGTGIDAASLSGSVQQESNLRQQGTVSGGIVGGVDANTIGNTQNFDSNVG